jgi:predicted RecB family endonuclease
VLRFEWRDELNLIKEFMETSGSFNESQKVKVLDICAKQQTKLDLKVVKKFAKRVSIMEKASQEEEVLKEIMLKSQPRLNEAKRLRISDISEEQMKAQGTDFKLHKGFEKICGLKGSMLSGGQK